MAIQPSFPHLTQGRVPDVSNCEELRNRHSPFSTKLCTLVLKTVVHNLSGAQPANFFYDRMTILWETRKWRPRARAGLAEKNKHWRPNRWKFIARLQPTATEPPRRIRRFYGVCTFSC